MEGTYVRNVEEFGDLGAGLSRADKIATLRSRMAALGGEVVEQVAEETDILPVGDGLERLLAQGGLPRRSVTHLSDTPALAVELIDQVTSRGGFAGVVGWPELSYAGIGELQRVVAVPDPGTEPLSVASVLVEGLDLVIYRSAVDLTISPVRARPILARLRAGHAALLLVGTKVQSPALSISAQVADFRGIGQGSGRITGMDLNVRTESKGHRPSSGILTVGQAGGQAAGHAAGTAPQRHLRAVR
ncbi:hypothetical protein [Corynebacterium lubricantis]|uniref:hypothetical protein n=1 Tax=Corynebacterium lubricantis TaxID=541095 RepID=UPI0003A31E9F